MLAPGLFRKVPRGWRAGCLPPVRTMLARSLHHACTVCAGCLHGARTVQAWPVGWFSGTPVASAVCRPVSCVRCGRRARRFPGRFPWSDGAKLGSLNGVFKKKMVSYRGVLKIYRFAAVCLCGGGRGQNRMVLPSLISTPGGVSVQSIFPLLHSLYGMRCMGISLSSPPRLKRPMSVTGWSVFSCSFISCQ